MHGFILTGGPETSNVSGGVTGAPGNKCTRNDQMSKSAGPLRKDKQSEREREGGERNGLLRNAEWIEVH